MRGRKLRASVALGVALALLVAGSAYALHLRAGNLVVDGDGGFAPRQLPKDHAAPIRAFLHGSIGTVDGTRPSPLRKVVLEVDKHALVETRGLPTCSMHKLIATTTRRARLSCPGAIVGTGFGTVLTEMPEQAPIKTSSPITIFNGPPKDGNPTAIGHTHLDYPGPVTYLIPAVIEKIHSGRYGYRIEIDIPRIINDFGSPIYGRFEIGRKWHFGGRALSYANASCADGRLQARAQLTFKDETVLRGAAFKRCTIEK
jgi:hypothetical protein